jgi:hypothetical protein
MSKFKKGDIVRLKSSFGTRPFSADENSRAVVMDIEKEKSLVNGYGDVIIIKWLQDQNNQQDGDYEAVDFVHATLREWDSEVNHDSNRR